MKKDYKVDELFQQIPNPMTNPMRDDSLETNNVMKLLERYCHITYDEEDVTIKLAEGVHRASWEVIGWYKGYGRGSIDSFAKAYTVLCTLLGMQDTLAFIQALHEGKEPVIKMCDASVGKRWTVDLKENGPVLNEAKEENDLRDRYTTMMRRLGHLIAVPGVKEQILDYYTKDYKTGNYYTTGIDVAMLQLKIKTVYELVEWLKKSLANPDTIIYKGNGRYYVLDGNTNDIVSVSNRSYQVITAYRAPRRD